MVRCYQVTRRLCGSAPRRRSGTPRGHPWQHGLRAASTTRLRCHLCVGDPTCVGHRATPAGLRAAGQGRGPGRTGARRGMWHRRARPSRSCTRPRSRGGRPLGDGHRVGHDEGDGAGPGAQFLVADALRLVDLGERFDTVLDCGLFHVLDDVERRRYVDSLAAAVPPGGRFHMLCFSDGQPGDWGPRRVAQDEIRAALSDGWEVESIEPAVIDLTWDPAGAIAWLVAARRMSG